MPRILSTTLLLAALAGACSPATGNRASAPSPAGASPAAESPAAASLPFRVDRIGDFDAPFAMAFLPDGRLLVTEKGGTLRLRGIDGKVIAVAGVPRVAVGGQGGLLDVAVAPDFARSHAVYLSYAEPRPKGSSLALARATVVESGGAARLDRLAVIWRAGSDGRGGQFGAVIAFAPDGASLFLSSGERQRFTPAQDPDQALGKIIHLTLDGRPAPGNPMAAAGGVRAATWSSGHRNPYGLAFAADGRLWETEMGPMGGDEVNLILPGRDYGWPQASNGDNYDGTPIPDHRPGDGFEPPRLFWNPSISPGGLMIYSGAMFPAWRGSGFIAALGGEALIRVTLSGGSAAKADRWDMGTRLRDVTQAPDGAIWLLEDGGRGDGGRLLRLTPRR